MSRPVRLTLAFLAASAAVGLVATLDVVYRARSGLAAPSPALVLAGAALAIATAANLFLRFLRWHYLARLLGARLPTVPSLGAFVGSFALLPVPLYLGQLWSRARLAPTATAAERGGVVVASVWERVFDVWALAALCAAGGSPPLGVAVVAATLVALAPAPRTSGLRTTIRATLAAVRLVTDEPFEVAPAGAGRVARLRVTLIVAALSLAAWAAPMLAVVPLARAAGVDAAAPALVAVAARATLLGAASLVPLGAGVMGLLLVRGLRGLGANAGATVAVAVVFRTATVWLTVAIGALALWLALRRRARAVPHDHFDAIDECYDAWLPEHYRRHLVGRKTAPIRARLADLPPGARGLDIGCGRGWYLADLRAAGARMVGVDMSRRQLVAAAQSLPPATPLAQGTVTALPFRAATFDFAYIVNVLHHVPSPAEQRAALAEIARVVRPGGLVFVHEMNVRNPLFRLYLSYVFPIVKGIEEGTEHYLDPDRMRTTPGLRMADVRYFTFVPDFVPRRLIAPLARVERRLEASVLARYAAHFVVVYERGPDAVPRPADPAAVPRRPAAAG